MEYTWVLKLKLKDKFREEVEDYFISLNASISSIDAENNLNTLNPKLFNTNIFFTNKPNINLIKIYLVNFPINTNNLILLKIKNKALKSQNNKKLNPINIGRFIFTEEKIYLKFNITKNIIIPAAAGFGTGHHPTTEGIIFILNKINSYKDIKTKDIIDIGCGSGILGIVMAKLWKNNIELIDIDLLAVKTSIYNAKINLLHTKLNIKKGNGLNITQKKKYDLITINILAIPILKNSYLINKKLKPKGRVIISGILHSQIFMILNKLRSMGLVLEMQYNKNNWSTLLLKKG
ncbi:50S ribosomal protein L11 methyltransferase [Alphaproteobacteria bacterium]|nr:50S ribosomal protein L11 methyltransferase [Alphaproteobacteria bacterium]